MAAVLRRYDQHERFDWGKLNAALQAVRDATSRKLPAMFFTWQNLDRALPLPFWLIQRYVFDRCRVAIADDEGIHAIGPL